MSKPERTEYRGPKPGPNYLYAIGSVTVVLFLLGLFGMIILQSGQMVSYFKERINVMIELQEGTSQTDIDSLQTLLAASPYIRKGSLTFISKEEALELLRDDFGEDFMKLDLPNPLYDVILFNVRSAYMRTDSLDIIRSEWRQYPAVSDVYYQQQVVDLVANNVRRVSWVTFGFGIFFVFIAFVLIHNTIRLALYSNRRLIKNMELVGASWGFISKPFLLRSIRHGLISALLAIGILTALLFWLHENFPDLRDLQNWYLNISLFAALAIFGVLINLLSTYYTINKYLKMRVDEVY